MALTSEDIQKYRDDFNINPERNFRVFRIIPDENTPIIDYDPIKYFSNYSGFAARALVGRFVEAIVSFEDGQEIEINDPDGILQELL